VVKNGDGNDRYVKWHDMAANTWKLTTGGLALMGFMIIGGGGVFAWHSADAKSDRGEIKRSIEKLGGKVDKLILLRNQ